MNSDLLIDAIGLIDDEYIKEAHTRNNKREHIFNNGMFTRLALGAICLFLVVLIIPKFDSYKSSDSSDMNYQENYSENFYTDNGGSADYMNSNSDLENDLLIDTKKEKKILNASMDMETVNLEDALNPFVDLVYKYGGYIQSSSESVLGNSGRRYYATVRIPADDYATFIEELKKCGNVTHYSEDIDDITETYSNIEAKLVSYKAEEQRLLEFYNQAENLEEVIMVEDRLTQIRYDIDYLENIIKNYDLLVSYSTLQINISETKVYSHTSEKFSSRLINSFRNGLHSFINGMGNLLVDFVYNIWVFAFVALVVFVAYRIYKVYRNRKNKKH